MKFAEDHRRDTMICLAGYAAGMTELLSTNSGLRSRFPHNLEFDSNTPQEIVDIAELFARRYRVSISAAALDHFAEVANGYAPLQLTTPMPDSSSTSLSTAATYAMSYPRPQPK